MSAHPRAQAKLPSITVALCLMLVTMLVLGGVFLWATAQAPQTLRTPVYTTFAVLSVVLSVVVAAATYAAQLAWYFRGQLRGYDADATDLADETLPAVVRRLRDGASVDTALAEVRPPMFAPHRRLLGALVDELVRGERMRGAAVSICAGAAARVQAMTTSMLADLREMQNRHGEDVLGDLMKIDHSTAQMGRLADNIAVLTGGRSGRRWPKPIVMESILRGAVGRIGSYQRVRLHSASAVAIVGYAAEGVMHALAEVMDNATNFSPPTEDVHVYVEEVQAGVAVSIEDGGLVMSEHVLQRAQRAVSAEPLDLTMLSGNRLGLAVVGCLARKHGLTVSFRPSSRGGTAVVVLIPRALLTEPPRQELLPAAHAEPTAVMDSAVDGLPKRARGVSLTAPPVAPASADAAAKFASFRRANGASPDAPPPDY